MAPQFTSAPTQYVVRPFFAAPCPVTLPIRLTNIIPEQFPLPRILMDVDTSRTPTPPPRPERVPTPPYRAPTPAAPRQCTPNSRESSLLTPPPENSEDENSASTAKISNDSDGIARPSSANIQTVKSLFKDRYPHLTELEQDKQYADFRVGYFRTSIDASLDRLCTQYLRPSVALSYQEKDKLTQVYTKVGHTIHGIVFLLTDSQMTDTFPWLAEYVRHWPVAVCLQGKLHNSAARAIEKSTKKVVNALAGVAPATGKKLKHK
ncbi:hypothetical protein K438DRAFT_1753588 [Mycena galopus ATCC 62051]|nr:hypothetical protein K438DRAFT_1753588 [Mycena galopus ATCC 62051]